MANSEWRIANNGLTITHHASRITHHVSRFTSSILQNHLDTTICLFIFAGSLTLYLFTLAPTVLEGDPALFQYTPYVLGVTYPTGFPLYILIGKIWLTLFPFGDVAWRMNFFSALCSALALPFIYSATWRLFKKSTGGTTARWTALAAVLTYATIPTFWLWSTQAKTYAPNLLLFAAVLYLLANLLHQVGAPSLTPSPLKNQTAGKTFSSAALPAVNPDASAFTFYASRITRHSSLITRHFSHQPLALPALLLGLQISVHNTAILLLPGLFLMVWFYFSPHLPDWRTRLAHLLLVALPGLFYLYIPLRAEWLIGRYGRTEAIEHGLLADFYHSGWAGWLRYYLAADFTGGVTTNWGAVPGEFFTRYLPILIENFTVWGSVLGAAGAVALLLTRPRLFWPLFLIYAVPIPFVLAYGQGEQSAFLLPSFLIFSLFLGYSLALPGLAALVAGTRRRSAEERRSGGAEEQGSRGADPSNYTSRLTPHSSRLTPHVSRFTPPFLLALLIVLLIIPHLHYGFNWLDVKWSRPIYEEWRDNLSHPLEPNAAILARWGDLTSLWYMQHVEGRRPDLRGIYPATEETVVAWQARNDSDLYLAGPLESWDVGVENRLRLIPWGRLVRIASRQVSPQTLMPDLPYDFKVIFENKLQFLSAAYEPQVAYGANYPVILTWQALEDLPPETTLSLRLAQGEAIITQLDETLLSGWFPKDRLPAGQYVLSYPRLFIPPGTLPGQYRLQLVVYTSYKQPWAMANGATLLDLGQVEVTIPATEPPLNPALGSPAGYDFNGEIALAGYEYTAYRVGQGKGFGVRLIWRTIAPPADNYTLLAEVSDAAGNILRSVQRQPVAGQAPTSTWQTGQLVRDQVDLVLPASAPPGSQTVQVRLSWLRPDGSKLKVRRWFIPAGDSLNLAGLDVTEKEDRVFEQPQVQYPLATNFDNKARLLGYTVAEPATAGLQLNQAKCRADPDFCRLHLDFYWQGINEMAELYSVFLHVVDDQGRIIAQHDRVHGVRGKQPTTGWLPGEVVIDPIELTLPPDLPAGSYSLRVGLYLPPAGPRLPALNQAGQMVGDFVEAGRLQVIP